MSTLVAGFGSGDGSGNDGTFDNPIVVAGDRVGETAAVDAAIAAMGPYNPASVSVASGAANTVLLAFVTGPATTFSGSSLTWSTLFTISGGRVMWAYSGTAVTETFVLNESPGISTTYALGELGGGDTESATAAYTNTSQLRIVTYTGAANLAPLYSSESGLAGTAPNCTFTTASVDSAGAVWVPVGTGYGTTVTTGAGYSSHTNQNGRITTLVYDSVLNISPGYTGNSSIAWTAYAFEVMPSGTVGGTFSKARVSAAGWYKVTLSFIGSISPGPNTLHWKAYRNNNVATGVEIFQNMTASTTYRLWDEDVVFLNPGDYINVRMWRETGATNSDVTGTFKMYVEKVS